MKWEEYKKLSREKREEYDFKFNRENNTLRISPITPVLVIFIGAILLLCMAIVVWMTLDSNYPLPQINMKEINDSVTLGVNIIRASIYIFALEFCFNVVILILTWIDRKKWLKKNMNKEEKR